MSPQFHVPHEIYPLSLIFSASLICLLQQQKTDIIDIAEGFYVKHTFVTLIIVEIGACGIILESVCLYR